MNRKIKKSSGVFCLVELLVIIAIICLCAAMLIPRAARAQGQVTPPYSTFAPNYWKQLTNVQTAIVVGPVTNVITGWQTNAVDVIRQANGEAFIASITVTNATSTNTICGYTNIPAAYLNNVKQIAIRGYIVGTNAITFLGDVTADGTTWSTTDPVQWIVPYNNPITQVTLYGVGASINLFEASRSLETGSVY